MNIELKYLVLGSAVLCAVFLIGLVHGLSSMKW